MLCVLDLLKDKDNGWIYQSSVSTRCHVMLRGKKTLQEICWVYLFIYLFFEYAAFPQTLALWRDTAVDRLSQQDKRLPLTFVSSGKPRG